MPSIKISEIVITKRARKELGDDFEELKTSIELRGLLHPVVMSKNDNELVAGFRRLQCHIALGLTEIEVKYMEDLSPLEKKLLELEENIHKVLTWDEQAELRAEIHLLQQEIHGKATRGHESNGWGLEDSAEEFKVSASTMSQDMRLSRALEEVPEIRKIGSRRQALKAIDRLEELALLTEIARLDAEEGDGETSTKQPYLLVHGDAIKETKKYLADETVDLVIFDPPWGIDAHIMASGRGPSGTKISYDDDSASTAVNTAFALLPELHRVMKPDAHMYMFIGIQFKELYHDFLTNFAEMPLRIEVWKRFMPSLSKELDNLAAKVEEIRAERTWSFHVEMVPLIWVKEGGGFTDFDHKFMPRYETILFCSKGEKKKLNEVSSNIFEYNRPLNTERIHTQEKPIGLIRQFIKLSSQPNEIVFDPCAGSFVTAMASTFLGRRSVSIEENETAYLKGAQRLTGMQVSEEPEEEGEE